MSKEPAGDPSRRFGPSTLRTKGRATDPAPEERLEFGFDVTPDDPPARPGPAAAVRQGGCLCGAVRYVLQGDPKVVGLCHCGDCRKATGGFSMPYADWPNSVVTVMGELVSYDGRSFCPKCGSNVVHLNPHHVQVNLGTLDDAPSGLRPTRELWTSRREPWLPAVPGAEQFERDPD